MARLREIKKVGGSTYIMLTPADLVDFGIFKGEFVDIENLFEHRSATPKKTKKK